MMESSTFKIMMLIGGIMILGTLFYFTLSEPFVPIDSVTRQHYENTMGGPPRDDNGLTIYESILFSIEAHSRYSVKRY